MAVLGTDIVRAEVFEDKAACLLLSNSIARQGQKMFIKQQQPESNCTDYKGLFLILINVITRDR